MTSFPLLLSTAKVPKYYQCYSLFTTSRHGYHTQNHQFVVVISDLNLISLHSPEKVNLPPWIQLTFTQRHSQYSIAHPVICTRVCCPCDFTNVHTPAFEFPSPIYTYHFRLAVVLFHLCHLYLHLRIIHRGVVRNQGLRSSLRESDGVCKNRSYLGYDQHADGPESATLHFSSSWHCVLVIIALLQ